MAGKFRYHFPMLSAFAAVAVMAVAAKSPGTNEPTDDTQTTVGTEGTYFFRTSKPLEVVPFEEKSPLLVRVANVTQDGDSLIHEVRFIGFNAGKYDLRQWLMYVDGGKLTDVPTAVVTVESVLPADHSGELAAPAEAPLPWAWPYRTLILVFTGLWLAPLVWVLAKGVIRRKPAVDAEIVGPTLADQLSPLVHAVLAGRSNPHQQAELERLLLAYWREKLQLQNLPREAAMDKIRRDSQGGQLLRQLESWLYARPGQNNVDVAALLAPYKTTAAIPRGTSSPQTASVGGAVQ